MLSFNSICWRPILSYRGMMTVQILGYASHKCKASALPCIVLFILSPDFPSTKCRDFTCWTQFRSVQSLIYVRLFVTPWTAARQTSCPSPISRAYSNSCRWCHPTISSSVVSFSSHLQFFPASGSFPMSQFFTSGGQSIGVSVSVLPMNIQDWFPLGLTGWISLQSKGLSRVFSNTTVPKHQFFGAQLSLWSNSHIHTWLLEKP